MVLPGGPAEAETSTAVLTRTECRRGRGAAVVWSRWHMFAWLPAALLGMAAWGAEETHTVPYVPSASSEGHAGVVRIESRSEVSGQVRVVAVDDAGQRMEAGLLNLGAKAAVEFEIDALESGDASLGLAGTGPGEGDWRLELTTELDIEARAYARSEGFLTALHDAALLAGEVELPLFHPGGAARPRGVLRLANAGAERATVAVRGVDDAGRAGGAVTVELAAWEARGYAASELESGVAAGLSGSLGDGAGKWRLFLEAERGSAYATNLLLDGSVLSSAPGGMSWGAGGLHRVSLFPSASDGSGRRGVVRVVNRSPEAAEVSIEAFDATDRAYERSRLSLGGHSSEQFDSMDLELGNSEKGLEGSTGSGEGDWWLELTSGSDIEVLSYVDMATGPLSAVRGTAGVETGTGMRYEALLAGESGELRLLNAGGGAVAVRVSGTDDAGAPGGEVELTLAPWVSRTLTREALEEGEAGLRGALGSGTGSWRLSLEADGEIDVLSLVRGAGGMLSDVSRRGRPAGAPPRTDVIDATASRADADLWVAASASEAELSPGEAFDLTATVGNRGEGEASATTLRYYRSPDAEIATTDTQVGTDAVDALAASGSSAESTALTAPSTSGTYYYGACADAVPEEAATSNNCSPAVTVTVTVPEPTRRPDLAVAASTGEVELSPGAPFSLAAWVRNLGDVGASATTLRYYRSADAEITAADAELGTARVSALAAGDVETDSLGLSAPAQAGTYYYGACADAVPEEAATSNNCSAAVPVTVTVPEPTRRPDLAVAASTGEVELSPGAPFSLAAWVRNLGDVGASATTLRYYRSADAEITAADAELGTARVSALAAGDVETDSLGLSAPAQAGTYYYGACADAVPEEAATSNNCSAAVPVTVTVPPRPPDLAVTASTGEVELSPGAPFSLAAWVRNLGDVGASATTLRYYRSADAEITAADAELGTARVSALAAGDVETDSLGLSAPAQAGTYYYGACADAVPEEAATSNNCSPAMTVTVTVPPRPPDLAVTASTGEVELSPGAPFSLAAWVRNLGDVGASATTLRYYRSADAEITAADAELGTARVSALAAGDVETDSLGLSAPAQAGTYYYGACADAVPEEAATSNNCSAAVPVTVTVPPRPPDLAVTASTGEVELSPGAPFSLAAWVRNLGDVGASATTLRYYRSADAEITAADAELGTARVSALAAGDVETDSLGLSAPAQAGTYYYGACADAVPEESATSNNCSAAVTVTVTVPEPTLRPDLAVVSASGPDESLLPSETFTMRATVRNVGAGSAPKTWIGLYRSEDAVVSPSDDLLGSYTVTALAVGGTMGPYQWSWVTAPPSAGTYYYGACVIAVPYESDTSNNCSAVEVTVREPSGRPDLTIMASSSGPCEFTATVSNVGTEMSVDTRLTWHEVGVPINVLHWGVPPLHPGQDVTKSHGNIWSGRFYACVIAPPGETVTDNNCSAVVEVTPH